MDNNKLNYLKEEFLKDFKFNLYVSENNSDLKHFKDFFDKMPEFRQKVIEADSKDNLLITIKNISEQFHQKWSEVDYRKRQDNTLHKALLQFYYTDSHLSDREKWMDDNGKMYDDKVNTGILKQKTTSDLDFKEWIDLVIDKDNNLENNILIQEKSTFLTKKYNFSYINLTKAPNAEAALDYLNKLDKCADTVAKDMNMPNEFMGIKGTVGIAYNTINQASQHHLSRVISLDPRRIERSTFLHEWIHALDSHIYEAHIQQSGYTSNNEKIMFHNTSSATGKAFSLMRELTQSICSHNEEEIKKIIEQKTEAGLSKFWSVIIGPEWYGMTNEQRKDFFSEEVKNVVSDFLFNPKDEDFISDLRACIIKHGNYSFWDADDKIDSSTEYLKEHVAPYFKEINANIIGKKSTYFIFSNLANLDFKRKNMINKVIEYCTGKKPLVDVSIVGTNYGKSYYTEPCELVARYFESQVYRKIPSLVDILKLCFPYKLNKDSDFNEKKSKILEAVFEPEKTLDKIQELRKKFAFEPLGKNAIPESVTMKMR